MRILLTGHTGFKGTWLTFLLSEFGHEIHGLSLPSAPLDGIYRRANASERLASEQFCDLADEIPRKYVDQVRPDWVIHFASQSLVSEGFKNPMKTFQSNITGTLNLLESVNNCDSIKCLLVATSDKVYSHKLKKNKFQESDPLGGVDPYSSSKAVQDFLVQQRVEGDPNWNLPTSVVRAGNVIGFGDVNSNRLLPDIVRAYSNSSVLKVRNPMHIRPWQHVLDCLAGYILAANYSLENHVAFDQWNFGPQESDISVLDVIRMATKVLDFDYIEDTSHSAFSEATNLSLSADKARETLGWSQKLTTSEAVKWTLEPVNDLKTKPQQIIAQQVRAYLDLLPKLPNPV